MSGSCDTSFTSSGSSGSTMMTGRLNRRDSSLEYLSIRVIILQEEK
jgi:hypothetical protein